MHQIFKYSATHFIVRKHSPARTGGGKQNGISAFCKSCADCYGFFQTVCSVNIHKTVFSGASFDFLCRLAERSLPVLIISGNHDSPERLAFGGRLMEGAGIHLFPVYDGKVHSITLSDSHGPVHFWLLPFVKPAHMKRHFPDAGIESYTDALRAAIA